MKRFLMTSMLAVVLWGAPSRAAARVHTLAHEPEADSSSAAGKALGSAEVKWQALRADAKRSRLRCNWTKVTGLLERVAERYPHSAEAPQALLEVGQAYEDLARVSFNSDDYGLAVTAYQKVTAGFANASQAEDAHLALAHLYRHKLHQEDKARAELAALAKDKRGHHSSNTVAEKKSRSHAKAVESDDDAPNTASAPAPKAEAAKVEVAKAETPKAEVAKVETPKAAATPAPASPTPAAPAPEVAKAEAHADSLPTTSVPTPIVAPETLEGLHEAAPLAAEVAPTKVTEAPLFKPSEVVATHADREHLDKARLAALRSVVRTSDELPLSAQMGLKVRRVVIDAGHGGHDTGAIGPSGVKEKDVSLAIAKRLAEKLRLQGLEVLLSRPDDHFVSLEHRTAFANENRADLFVSIHCNAATDAKLRGVETYSLNLSSNQYAMRLAARENATSERSISDLQYLLADLTTKANTTDSRQLAHLVQSSVTGGLREKYDPVRDLGTKEALFYVLMGTRMPSILVETSFISNSTEERRLGDAAFQDQLAGSIAAGIARFVDDRQSLGGTPVAGLP